MAIITVTDHQGRFVELKADTGHTLAQAVYLSGRFSPPALCSGLGRCGLCRMRLKNNESGPDPRPEDFAVLGDDAVSRGWRLGCVHPVRDGLSVELPPQAGELLEAGRFFAEESLVDSDSGIAPPRNRGTSVSAVHPEDSRSGDSLFPALAVDLGTTSIHWDFGLAGAGEWRSLASGRELNPQMGAGSEVMSRLAFVRRPDYKGELGRLVSGRLAGILKETREACGEYAKPELLCVSGNPAMTYILLNLPVDGLACAPYSLSYRGGSIEEISGLPGVYIPPQIAPFVGGDVSAGLAALLHGENPPSFPFLLADLGTNGEFILAVSPRKFLCASVPMGPSLEGIGLGCGTVASPGAATGFGLSPQGLTPRRMNGSGARTGGVTGTGYLSLCALLRRVGVLDGDGRFCVDPASPLGSRLVRGITDGPGGARLPLPDSQWLDAADVEELLKVKAAFGLAFSALLNEAGLEPHELSEVILAGALGEYADTDDLEILGFLPPGMGGSVRTAGNASLAGARLLLARPELREPLAALAADVRSLDLTGSKGFADAYLAGMRFEWTG